MSALPLLSIAYAPPLSYYKLLSLGSCSVEVHETFQKQTFRNRCRILTPQGVEDLVIPIEQGGRQDCPIREVRISSHDHWWTRHLQALKSAYGKSPFLSFTSTILPPLRMRKAFLSLRFQLGADGASCSSYSSSPVGGVYQFLSKCSWSAPRL